MCLDVYTCVCVCGYVHICGMKPGIFLNGLSSPFLREGFSLNLKLASCPD